MYQRIVVKLGTSVLTGGTPRLHRPTMVELTRQCAVLQRAGKEIVLTSSGAQAAGRERLGFPELAGTLNNRQMLAAVGQSRLMLLWERFFEIYDIHVGQVLLTRADVESRRRYLNARDTLLTLIEQRIVPVINENDAVTTEEIRVGDNDNLSALVATLVQADLLLLLTDQPGLFTADPRTDPQARLIDEVEEIDDALRALAGGSVSGLGVGGMSTKLQAADLARRSGVDVVIAAGSAPEIIARAVAGESVGTRFRALTQPLESRKQWILAGPKPAGVPPRRRRRRARPAPPGPQPAAGRHQRRRRPVSPWRYHPHPRPARRRRGPRHHPLRQRRAAAHCRLQSDAIAARLGYDYGPVAVHRNDLILL